MQLDVAPKHVDEEIRRGGGDFNLAAGGENIRE